MEFNMPFFYLTLIWIENETIPELLIFGVLKSLTLPLLKSPIPECPLLVQTHAKLPVVSGCLLDDQLSGASTSEHIYQHLHSITKMAMYEAIHILWSHVKWCPYCIITGYKLGDLWLRMGAGKGSTWNIIGIFLLMCTAIFSDITEESCDTKYECHFKAKYRTRQYLPESSIFNIWVGRS